MSDINFTLFLVRLFIIIELSLTGIFILWFVVRNWSKIIPRRFRKSKIDIALDNVYECLGNESERIFNLEQKVFKNQKPYKK